MPKTAPTEDPNGQSKEGHTEERAGEDMSTKLRGILERRLADEKERAESSKQEMDGEEKLPQERVQVQKPFIIGNGVPFDLSALRELRPRSPSRSKTKDIMNRTMS